MNRLIASVALLLAFAAGAHANEGAVARKYAVLSLIGDSMTVVTYSPSVGSRLDRNTRESIMLNDTAFDQAAIRAVAQALSRVDAKNSVLPFTASSPGFFSEQRKLFDGGRVMLGDDLVATLRSEGASRLVLLTKFRGEARVGDKLTTGSGYLEGLGFYVDRITPTDRVQWGDWSQGFLAPYAYVKVSLVDLDTRNVLREQVVTASQVFSPAVKGDNRDPWAALSPAEKAGILQKLITAEVERVVPLLVTPRA